LNPSFSDDPTSTQIYTLSLHDALPISDITLNTAINDNANDGVPVTAVPLGATVHDHASFSGQVGTFVPTLANVSYTFDGVAAGRWEEHRTELQSRGGIERRQPR